MDKLIKTSIQLVIEKEGYGIPEHKKKWVGYWSSARWYVTLSGKTEGGHTIIYTEDAENLGQAIEDLRNEIKKLCDDTDITFKTLSKFGEKGVLLHSLIDRNGWYIMFLNYLDTE